MDFMSDDFASFCPVMDLSTNNKASSSSPVPSNGEDGSSEAGGGGGYMTSLRSRSRTGGRLAPSQGSQQANNMDQDDNLGGAFSMKETFHLLDSVHKHLGELTNPKLKKYRIWVRIAEDINKVCDSKFNGGQCSSRFRNLKCRFGKVQTHYKTTGELKTWPFYNRMLGMFPDEASFNWLNTVVANDPKQDGDMIDGDEAPLVIDEDDQDEAAMMIGEQDGEDDEAEASPTNRSNNRARGGHVAGFTTNSAGELVPCFTLRESMTLLDVVKKHIAELKDPRTCKGKIWAKVAAEVNKKCSCSHTGAQCSARYRNLKCRFLKRRQKGTDMTWTFGAKLAQVLDAESEVKVEMANGSGSTPAQSENNQLSSLLGKEETVSVKAVPSPTVTAADLRSHQRSIGQKLQQNQLQQRQQQHHQPLDLGHNTRSHHGGSLLGIQQQQQQQRRRSRISTSSGSRPSTAQNLSSPKELISSGQVNLVSHRSSTSPAASIAEPLSMAGQNNGNNDCFTASETVTLLDLVAKYLKDLNSPAESGVRRHDIWTRIAAELNDAYGTRYTSTQCSARFRNLKCRYIKTQEYNRVTGADKKVAFNDNIARLFAAEAAMGAAGVDNLDNSSGSEQISPMPMAMTTSSNKPSSYTNGNGSFSTKTPPGAHSNNSQAFQTSSRQQQQRLPPPPSSPYRNNSSAMAPVKQNGAAINGRQNGPYFDQQQRNLPSAHSRSPSSTAFALPQTPVHHQNNHPQRPQSHLSTTNSRSTLTASPNLFGNRSQAATSGGLDLSNASIQNSSAFIRNARPSLANREPKIGREAVIEQLRLMHEDWVGVTERRHQEILGVLRQLADTMTTAGLATPVSLVDGATAAALLMSQAPNACMEDGAEELLLNDDVEMMEGEGDDDAAQDEEGASYCVPNEDDDELAEAKEEIASGSGEPIEGDDEDIDDSINAE